MLAKLTLYVRAATRQSPVPPDNQRVSSSVSYVQKQDTWHPTGELNHT
jgi:hypothetical protein